MIQSNFPKPKSDRKGGGKKFSKPHHLHEVWLKKNGPGFKKVYMSNVIASVWGIFPSHTRWGWIYFSGDVTTWNHFVIPFHVVTCSVFCSVFFLFVKFSYFFYYWNIVDIIIILIEVDNIVIRQGYILHNAFHSKRGYHLPPYNISTIFTTFSMLFSCSVGLLVLLLL